MTAALTASLHRQPRSGMPIALLNKGRAGPCRCIMPDLEIRDLTVAVDGKKILDGLSLSANLNEVNAIMGPNGSGKSTLAFTIMGHPKYEIQSGTIFFKGEDITRLPPDQRAKKGLFLSFQYPSEIPGVTIASFLRTSYNTLKGANLSVLQFHKLLAEKMSLLHMDKSFASRYLNEGFSGGEKKRAEILQLAVLEPAFAVLDETDSGTDVDALKIIAEGVNTIRKNTHAGFLLITHYDRILRYIQPDRVHIMAGGKVVAGGGPELAQEIEKTGYKKYLPGELITIQ